MRVLPPLFFALTANAFPTPSWSSVQDAWNKGWTTAAMSTDSFGWNDFAGLEDVMRAPTKSVWQWLVNDKDSSKLVKLISYDQDIVKILDGASHGLTFFAPNNDAIPDRKHKPKKDVASIQLTDADALSHLSTHLDALDDDDDDDDDKKKKREILKKILHSVLLYHILPYEVTTTKLAENSTVHTALLPEDGSFDNQYRRIHLDHTVVPPSLTINKYVTVVKSDIAATNGLVNVVDHPLFPPPSILDIAFILPQWLSTSTSAIQKLGLEDTLQYHYVWDEEAKKGHFEGTGAITAFIPNNDAWKKLPEKLIVYLFSPFGEKALKKLLQFHIVPNYIVLSEWIHKNGEDHVDAQGVEIVYDYPFPTALANHTLGVHIKKSTPKIPIPGVAYWEFKVQGQEVHDRDLVARNGAFHTLTSVLDPRKSHGHHGDDKIKDPWADWEEWLPIWAEEA